MRNARRVLLAFAWFLIPYAASLVVSGYRIPGSTLWPWNPNSFDLEIYQRTGQMVLAGQNFYDAPQGYPWIYPPFPALFTTLLAPLSVPAATALWDALSVAVLTALLYRLGFSGGKLALAATICVLLVDPVNLTIGYGQVGILLVGLVCLDSLPGRRFFRRRLLPEGWLIGLGAAVKLTPAVSAAYLFSAGRRKPGLAAFFTFCACTAVGFAVFFQYSADYWLGLLHGNTGMNDGLPFCLNQSIMGALIRLTHGSTAGAMVLIAVVAVAGIAVCVLIHRCGQAALALCLSGLTALLASPISWSHHWVWIVPLAVVLWKTRELPAWYRFSGLFLCLWMAVSPFKWLPNDHFVEYTYGPAAMLLANFGVYLGLLWLLSGFVLAQQLRKRSASLPR
ncbi:MAG: glycosyltransferase 87 family protein [Propionibacteriaceae bacterium]|nr:glycosyltransferase 87 family protein [Propionibacteriaceae bacterium]